MNTEEASGRIVEAYIGEYASGKSEIAINRALELRNQGRPVTLVDLDIVEPFYTLRPLKEKLEQLGLNVVSFSRADSFGLGETGAMLNPRARWALRQEGDIILDIGYGVYGAKTLNLVEGAAESEELQVYAVVNYSRPMTGTKERIKEYVSGLGHVDGIIANTHLGDQTDIPVILEGDAIIIEAAAELGIPVQCIIVVEELAGLINATELGLPVKVIKRYMPAAMW